MLNKRFIFSIFLAILFAFSTQAEDTDTSQGVGICDGTDPNSGEVLIPREWIERCKLCSEDNELTKGRLEFDLDCLRRLAYDLKYQTGQYETQIDAVKKTYTDLNLNKALQKIIKSGSNEERAENEAGYTSKGKAKETLLGELDKLGLGDIVEDVGNDLVGDNTGNDSGDESNISKCRGDQTDDSSRCPIEGNNYITAQNTGLLMTDLLATRAMIVREEVLGNITGYSLPNMDVRADETGLILPSDNDAEAQKGKKDE